MWPCPRLLRPGPRRAGSTTPTSRSSGLSPLKGDRTVSVCIPARDEASTVGHVVRTVVELTGRQSAFGLVDEVLVVDDGSTDDTAAVAEANGATVIANRAGGGGKGQAMRTALEASTAATWSSSSTPTSPTSGPTSSPGCSGPCSSTTGSVSSRRTTGARSTVRPMAAAA